MAITTLTAIMQKVRRLTGSPNTSQLSDSDIIDYINSFYLYDFPAEFRALDLKDVYTFNTVAGVNTYPFDIDHWVNLQAPAWCDKRSIELYMNPEQFYYYQFSSFPAWQQEEDVGTGDGSTTNFVFTVQNTPILRSVNNNPMVTTNTPNTSVFPAGFPVSFPNANIDRIQNILITANISNGSTLVVTDDGNGNLIGDVNGAGTNSIDYATGDIDVTFSSAPGDGEDVWCNYLPVVLNRPLALLVFQNQIVLSPVPDKGYTVEIVGYRLPSQALLGSGSTVNLSGRPEQLEWWETIAVGASKKVYEDRLDMDGVGMMDKMLKERYDANYTRTYANLGKERIATIYSDQLTNSTQGFPIGFGYNG